MIQYDARFGTPSDEVLRKLELSRMEVESMEKRNFNCPICGFRILGVYADRTGHAEVKCRKCKFEGPINLAYFIGTIGISASINASGTSPDNL